MTTSYSTVTTSQMELTPMRVKFKGVDLGGSLGNVTVNMEFPKAEIKADQLGTSILDRRVTGLNVTIETELAEIKNKDIWKVVFPHAHLVDGGLSGKQMTFLSNVGDSDLDNAGVLILHPLSKADADVSGDFKFFLACADAKSSIVYGPNDQARLKIIWNILPDTTATPAKYFVHGDPSIGLTAAAAGSPSFTGTGNGTMGSVSVYSGVTLTETITATCVHAATNGGTFSVSGSLSGALGIAVVGSPFTSSKISFTIADGSTDFAIGDAFTVATTASNYV